MILTLAQGEVGPLGERGLLTRSCDVREVELVGNLLWLSLSMISPGTDAAHTIIDNDLHGD